MPAMWSPPSNTTEARLLAALLALLLAALPARAQLSAAPAGGLAFGRFAAAGPGSVSVDAHGRRSAGGAVLLLPSAAAPARFTISDSKPENANLVYIVSLPAGATISAGAASMALTGFTSAPAGGGVLSGGSQLLSIGATLQVGAGQAAGNYSGSFHITIEYQ
ncbi:DUF4402 domain-containing protein [Massilia atriviolacea]|uniref:DUF4402 domain-containing protein n=1 Tax=Massilia atriviolacea TaxID=2495579 RepID=A0A430HQW6_9BURK|nr:DUF4402 domain-containing protein [Massilia atriviolacea]RSZ59907.1 DUF4402 domain-containing protein [Massilia atriviolacea]